MVQKTLSINKSWIEAHDWKYWPISKIQSHCWINLTNIKGKNYQNILEGRHSLKQISMQFILNDLLESVFEHEYIKLRAPSRH